MSTMAAATRICLAVMEIVVMKDCVKNVKMVFAKVNANPNNVAWMVFALILYAIIVMK